MHVRCRNFMYVIRFWNQDTYFNDPERHTLTFGRLIVKLFTNLLTHVPDMSYKKQFWNYVELKFWKQ